MSEEYLRLNDSVFEFLYITLTGTSGPWQERTVAVHASPQTSHDVTDGTANAQLATIMITQLTCA
jgi:hypothetical protein